MPSEPLSLLILLFFVLMIATALALWFLLTLGRGKREVESVDFSRRDEPEKPVRPPSLEINNDEVRGARAPRRAPFRQDPIEPHRTEPTRKRVSDETQSDRDKRDAFESFAHSKKDELDF